MAIRNAFGRYRAWRKTRLTVLVLLLPACLVAFMLSLKTDNSWSSREGVVGRNLKGGLVWNSTQDYHLVVLIMSDPTKGATRKAIRDTWLALPDKRIHHFFTVGTRGLTPEVLHDVIGEHELYGDVLTLENVAESYTNLTSKLLTSLQRVLFSIRFNFLLKCDDDSYVVLPRLLEALAKQPQERLYWGFFKGGSTVFRKGKWKESDWFVCDTYLPYALGGGYVLSSDLVQYLASNAGLLQLYNSEDASLGLWLAPLKINRIHDVRFDTEYRSRGCSNQYLVTHKQSANEMRQKHSHLVNNGQLCPAEVRAKYSYEYNWTVLPSHCCKNFNPDLP